MMRNQLFSVNGRPAASLFITCFWLVLITLFFSVSSGDSGGKEAFKAGRNNLDAGRYSDAISNFLIAQKEFGILEDYALFFIADAYHGKGEHDKALESIRLLLTKYPSSLLKKKARMAEIREAGDVSSSVQLEQYETYVRDFPEDDEAAYIYGQLLKNRGETEKAKTVFRRLYLKAGQLSSSSRKQLEDADISTSDLVERAANLSKQYEFEAAEHDLRQALASRKSKNRADILKPLAYALFKQKKYREAAEIYDEVNDTYYKARSLYRAGDSQGFGAALNTLVSRGDKKAGFLLLTVAADKRREKDFDRALQVYQDILKDYPADAEDALWGIGWTHYLAGSYQKAEETFSRLNEKYDDAKYLYWQARSMEAQNRDASNIYAKLASAGTNNFYTALSHARSRREIPALASLSVPSEKGVEKSGANEKVEALLSVGMRAEAVAELAALCRKTSSMPDILYSATKFEELGEFKRSISITTKLPYSDKIHRFWYPLAFWDKVENASRQNSIDPMIILSVMREESRFDQSAKSPAGAYGLMQLMPQTAYRLDKSLKLGINSPLQLTDPRNNIQLGSYYLKHLFDEFHSMAHMLAAYNAGELAVRNWKKRFDYRSADEFIEDIPYSETRNYVKKVLTSYFQYKRAEQAGSGKNTVEIILGNAL